jgi:hypothetical protein
MRGIVRDGGKGADDGVFPTAFWLREYTWVVLCSEKVLSNRHG